MKIRYLFELIWYFIITEIISVIELIVWFIFKDFFISLMPLENDVFGVRYGIVFALLAIPAILAYIEYKKKQEKISKALYNLFKEKKV